MAIGRADSPRSLTIFAYGVCETLQVKATDSVASRLLTDPASTGRTDGRLGLRTADRSHSGWEAGSRRVVRRSRLSGRSSYSDGCVAL
jgi:hypothetical protein